MSRSRSRRLIQFLSKRCSSNRWRIQLLTIRALFLFFLGGGFDDDDDDDDDEEEERFREAPSQMKLRTKRRRDESELAQLVTASA